MSKKTTQAKSERCPKAKRETLESNKDFQQLVKEWKQIPDEVARAERVAAVLSGDLETGYQSCLASLLGVTEGTIRRCVSINALNDVDKQEIRHRKSVGPILKQAKLLKRTKLTTGSAAEVPVAEPSSKQHENDDSTPAEVGTESSSVENDKTVSKSAPQAPPAGKNDGHERDQKKDTSFPGPPMMARILFERAVRLRWTGSARPKQTLTSNTTMSRNILK